jgi:tetratricopeptide (TPR) repeat protein
MKHWERQSRVTVLVLLCGLFLDLQEARGQTKPTDPERIFDWAVELHQSGDIVGAIARYEAYLKLRPRRLEARSNLGAAYARLGRYEEAVEQYKQALALDARNVTIRFNLGLAYYKTANIPGAETELAQVVAAQPENTNAVLLLADCQFRMGGVKKVIELLSPLDATLSQDRMHAYLLGTALILDNQTERGQVIIDRIFRAGESAEGHVIMGTAHLLAHDYPNALKELKRAVELNPALPGVHSLYGRAVLATGDPERAMAAFRLELERNPNEFEANLYLGRQLIQDGKLDEAVLYLQRALFVRPRDLNARYYVGSVYLSMNRAAEAQRVLEEVVKEAPGFVEAHVLLATAYYRLKRKEDGDREQAIIQELNAKRQAEQPGAQEGLGPAYRGERLNELPAPKPNPKP